VTLTQASIEYIIISFKIKIQPDTLVDEQVAALLKQDEFGSARQDEK